ncbi:hypothetical protein GCM10012280_07870 [Wenjunlia tyrosinilytica]|uniref:Uncharacterized protein n=1 Tax=Wenjunlia tyrosinilytica TaxID=1544741 RepID=A0A917ZHV0_9ACTN|nr:hypothetical protein GCM10012280_07870 [Wenjunlia tyrosinilytica]
MITTRCPPGVLGRCGAVTPSRHPRATGAAPGRWMLFTAKTARDRAEVNEMKVYVKPEAKKVDQGTIVAAVR